MSQIKGKNTKPEMLVRRYLHKLGFRYKLHDKSLPGKPDLVFVKYKTVVFIHGCFWHGHSGCRYYVIPKTRTDWWLNKINSNVDNDVKNLVKLKELGWNALNIWECDLKKDKIQETLTKLPGKLYHYNQ